MDDEEDYYLDTFDYFNSDVNFLTLSVYYSA